MTKTRLKSYSGQENQLRNNTWKEEKHKAVQRQLERRKLRRCKPVRPGVVAHTKENSPDVANKFLKEVREVFGNK